jgi:hypothetical protein
MASKSTRNEVIAFFETLFARRFSDAERAIEAMKEKKIGDVEFKEGYVNALEGLLLSYRSGDERDFLNRAPFDKKSMARYKKEFTGFVRDGVRSPFDIGFFMAWSDLLQYRLYSEKES